MTHLSHCVSSHVAIVAVCAERRFASDPGLLSAMSQKPLVSGKSCDLNLPQHSPMTGMRKNERKEINCCISGSIQVTNQKFLQSQSESTLDVKVEHHKGIRWCQLH